MKTMTRIEELETQVAIMWEAFESFSEKLDRQDLPLSQLVYQAKLMTDKALQMIGGKK